ncbi:24602_t:CDS:2, partial [Gigaspora rosea]
RANVEIPKAKIILNKPGDVKMNANSSSGNNNATKQTVLRMITYFKTSNTKKMAVLAVNSNKKSSLDNNIKSNESSNIKIEAMASSMILLTSELVDNIDSLELLLMVNVDKSPEKIANKLPGEIANKLLGAANELSRKIANKLPGATITNKPIP